METPRVGDSGVFEHPEQRPSTWAQPETIIVAVAWILAIVQIGIGIARFGAFGADRGVAIAFAIGCPWLLRDQLQVLARRTVGLVRGPSPTSKT